MTRTDRHAVESLLAGTPRQAESEVSATWAVGDRVIGLYEVLDVYEQGGMGVVYRVRHLAWNTELAVKSPRPELFRGDADRERFVREAETWVSLGLHPHVCSCYYVRTLGGIPRVFAEYMDGGSLREWIDERRLHHGGGQQALARVLDVAIQVAWGLQHSHDQGLVHQDMKPANVLLDAAGTAKVTDFGLARARPVPVSVPSGSGSVAGASVLVSSGGMTPAYASPEQMAGADLGRATDIWSFAVTVLEMFTGEVSWMAGPVAGAALADLRERGELARMGMPAAVAALLARCLRDDPAERPGSMSEVAAILSRIHTDETGRPYPRPEPVAARLRADELNNRALSLLDLGRREESDAAFQEALAVDPQHPEATYNAGVLHWRAGRITDERLVRDLGAVYASTGESARAGHLLANVHLERGDLATAVPLLEEAGRREPGNEEIQGSLDIARSGRIGGGDLLSAVEHPSWATARLSADGRYAVTGDGDGTVRLLDFVDGRVLAAFQAHGGVKVVCLSLDGTRLLTTGQEIVGDGWHDTLRLWDLRTGQCLSAHVHDASVESACLRADGAVALFGSNDGTVREWRPGIGDRIVAGPRHNWNGIVKHSVWLSADGRLGLSGTVGKYEPRLWDMETGRCLRTFEGHTDTVSAVHLSPDGRWALSGGPDRTVRLWNVETGDCVRTFEGHTAEVLAVWVSDDGRRAVSAGWDRVVRLWDVETGRCLRSFEGHTSHVASVCMTPDGRLALSAGGEGSVRLWELPERDQYWCSLMPCRPRSTAELSDLDARVESLVDEAERATAEGRPREALDLLTTARGLPGHERAPRVLPAWRTLARTCVRTGLRAAWASRTLDGHAEWVKHVNASADGTLAISQSWDETARLWEIETGRCLRTFDGHDGVDAAALSGSGRFALIGHCNGDLRFWDVAEGRCLRTFEGTRGLSEIRLSFDGRLALTQGRMEHTVRLYDTQAGRCVRSVVGANGVHSIALSDDGRLALIANGEQQVQVWDLTGDRQLPPLTGHTRLLRAVCLSADGRLVLSGGADPDIRLWDLATGRCLRTLTDAVDNVKALSMSADGRFALSGGEDAALRLWDVDTGECLRTLTGHTNRVTSVDLSADGRFALSADMDETVRTWELDWELQVHDPAGWDDGARPFLEQFLARQMTPAFSGHGRRSWSEEEFEGLIRRLEYAGYGWLSSAGVRAELERLSEDWQV
ncbi:protein kinase domain-containing protein [Actinomadura alba]|uniref:Protein kinase n=1 Tax=Actinomadura alba TaxID=406431 RepID=A0ABR7LPM8_9ACTN|nr:protein kinase [Actinomadura alba]MBC6466695.1 protein kinase [Actinomadura alba]